MKDQISQWLSGLSLKWGISHSLMDAVLIIPLVLLAFISDLLAKRLILASLEIVVRKSRHEWDDILLKHKVFKRFAHLAPALVVYHLGPFLYAESPVLASFMKNGASLFMIVAVIFALDSLLEAGQEIYEKYEVSKDIPLKGFVQAAKIALYFIGVILLLSVLTSRTPLFFLSGLGALTAVLMLIFKDAILGLVAGIQISTNNMVRVGDWIEMPQYNADGDVIEVSLTTVKVRNWDKTITTIPTYSLISSSFKNWRGMQESGGRRIKRAIYIDMSSIRFCDGEMLNRFAMIQYIRDYLERKKQEIARYNQEMKVDDASLINGRRLTNIGTFRGYVEAYLRNSPYINHEMTFLVRQLAPTEHGLPIEIYVFSREVAWARYEAIQADIFDHLLAAVPVFDLRVFQDPSGADFKALARGG